MSFSRDEDMTWCFFAEVEWSGCFVIIFTYHLQRSFTYHLQRSTNKSSPNFQPLVPLQRGTFFGGGGLEANWTMKKGPLVVGGLYGIILPRRGDSNIIRISKKSRDIPRISGICWNHGGVRVFFLPWKVMTRGIICWEYLLLASKNERVANLRVICYNQRPSSSPDCAGFHPCFIHIMVFPQAWSPRARAFQRGKSYGPSFFCVRLLVLLADIVFWHPSTEVFLSKRIG